MQSVKNIFFLLSLLISGILYSQSDTVKTNVKEKEKLHATKFYFGLDARKSRVFDQKVSFFGVKLGFNIDNKHRFGMGFYGLKKPIYQTNIPIDYHRYPDATDTNKIDFSYISFFYERVWLSSKRWELTTPFHIGPGGLTASYKDTSGVFKPYFKGGSWLVEVSGVAQFKVFRWFAIGAGFGQRWLLNKDKAAKQALNGPVTILQFKVLFGELFKMTFKRKELEEW